MISAYDIRNPLSPFRTVSRHLPLIVQMTRREVVGRYRGSFMGLFWSFFNPLLMLAIYTFVFGVIFKSRWNSQITGHFEFAIILFAGLNISTMFSECANRAPTLIIENANFVKKVVFPLETLTWSVIGSALFHLLVSTMVLMLASFVVRGHMPWTVVLFPIAVAVFIPFVAGVVWLLASLGVFLRDLKQAIGVITAALMFLAPILYPMSFIPEQYQWLMYLNPLTVIVMASQDVLIWGRQPAWLVLGLYLAVSCLFAWAAFAWFERSRRGFADVL